jgi:hypothetical protein
MARYLSPEWLAAADAATAAISIAVIQDGDEPIVVQHVVTDGPDGDVAYHVIADNGAVHVHAGAADHPTVTFTQDYATAAAVARGELSAQGAFMAGRIRVRGALERLVARGETFGALDDVLAPLRAETVY